MSATVYHLPTPPATRDADWNDHPRRSSVRLTRRGRVVVFTFTLAVLFVIAFVGARVAGAAQEKGADKSPASATHQVVVGQGDTLWVYASKAAAGTDLSVRQMELKIKDLNGLETSELFAGQSLILPN